MKRIALVYLLALALGGCGGGSGGGVTGSSGSGSVEGVATPASVSVVTATQ